MIQSLLASVQPLIILVSGDLARTGMDEHVSVENQRKDKGDFTNNIFLFVVLFVFLVTRDEVKRLQVFVELWYLYSVFLGLSWVLR